MKPRLWTRTRAGLAAALFLAVSISPPAHAGPDLSVQEILAKHTQALGGLDAIRGLKAMTSEGKITVGGLAGTFRSYVVYPSKMRNELDLSVFRQLQVVNGPAAWQVDQNNQVKDITGHELSVLLSECSMEGYRYLVGEPGEATVEKSTASPESTQYVTLKVTPRDGDPLELALDPATWLVRKVIRDSPVGRAEIYLSDYRPVGGVKMPFLGVQVLGGDAAHSVTTVTTRAEAEAALPDSLWRKPGTSGRDWGFPEGVHSLTIPVKILEHHVFVPVRVNHSGPLNFLLDTGAGATVVEKSVAAGLGLKSEGKLGAQGVGGSADYGITTLDTLEVGGAQLWGQHAVTLSLPDFQSVTGVTVGGVLGYDFISRFTVSIDYGQGFITLTEPGKWKKPAGATQATIELEQNVPVVSGTYGKTRGRYIVDTGNNGGLMLHGPYVRQHKLLATAKKKVEVASRGAGGEEMQTLIRGASFEFCGQTVKAPLVALSTSTRGLTGENRGFAGNIGGWLLEQFTVTFDYPHQRMYLERGSRYAEPMDLDPAGWQLITRDDQLVVAYLPKDCPAALAGVKEGDVLTEMEGQDVSHKSPYELRQLTHRDPGTKLHFTVRRGKVTAEVVLTLKKML